MKRLKPFATELSIASVNKIIDVYGPNSEGVKISVEQEEPQAAKIDNNVPNIVPYRYNQI